ncbi:gamma-glutamylcyclotransferase family protein [Thalassobius sp. Cn5-15]|uniref:gamma-glutamylcyclotransferase family protein n=1 Tax=Thalassobius sp. Cn5-15 TaxID=2917763 RepID=UPI001EF1ABD3|nr:gamma-glutamylcyclotransferase family protein [Thalassobius sp. Cn5-15]MCG7493380.1 gamma-glutamylcyclotransferase [Thalassobius sp. Cn5-15]
MKDAFFFGYGSLVNRATHIYDNAHHARVRGWRRLWRHTALRPIAFLTVVPDSQSVIDGLIAGVPGNDWDALDAREYAYDRVALNDQLDHALTTTPDTAIYTIPADKHGTPDRLHPVLLSYLDVVIQGYLNEFGEEGAQAFFASTDGWDAPILDDRAAPYYPRHRILSQQERALVDRLLDDAGAERTQHSAAEKASFEAQMKQPAKRP